MVQYDIHDKKANGKWRKMLGAKTLNKQIADFHFKMHDSNKVKQKNRLGDWGTSLDISPAFHHLIVQTESQPYLAFEFQNNHYTYRAIPFGTKHSPIFFATAMEPIMQQIRMKTEIRVINYVDDIFLLHQNKDYLKNMTQKVKDSLKYFEFTMNTEKSETEPKQKLHFPEFNGPSESICGKTERMEYNDDNEQDRNSKHKLVDSEIQSDHSSIVNTDISTNDNDNRCSTQ
ncbi:MAG: hypothetical protein EZS28_010476 [Streblomastix strix]|uniref:Reverse transcriptase domain-containing protein n=1 Tax=Streblomastix strix TaxID=222440 RepID=A0A5J4WGD4_9EUKA|nr:MAG: hypothetical protein EZS28_010476 [Streblomastix strix]